MATLRISYVSDYRIVLPEKFVETSASQYVLTEKDLPVPNLRGFQFEGWYLDNVDYETQVFPGYQIFHDTKLYAKWTETEVSITTGLGKKQFRLRQLLDYSNYEVPIEDSNKNLIADNDNVAIADNVADPFNLSVILDDPKTLEKLYLDAKSIIVNGHFDARKMLTDIDSRTDDVASYINVRKVAQ